MLLNTYDKVEELFRRNHNYLQFEQLKENKITTIQIKEMVERKRVERFSRGFYWNMNSSKTKNYKMIELCMVNKNAVVCADSACYYWGLLSEEPMRLSFATRRNNRSKTEMAFPTNRHYFSDYSFETDICEIETGIVPIRVYGMDKSVADAIRYRELIPQDVLEEIVGNYRLNPNSNEEALYAYADKVHLGRIVYDFLNGKS